ncbi:hypothetical protein Rhopal_005300-T1 [Rhodotorula paludigena]|uniref:NADPH oxidase regulator NoxR n=1 Tax=Rhodotorula paludigena TaxID=86838 RepID=A0AAV5GI12_9BASI|nr:hypothetical protein Rhopal_005300-T1 [Rhodotorula paludigena]
MSLKQELQVWSNALQAFDAQDYGTALARFKDIADTSKILFNVALIHATVGQHDQAVAAFDRAIALDSYFAVAYFQSGVSQFLLGRYEAARRDFDDALAFKLFSCEVRFNRGLSLIYMGRIEEGMRDLEQAKGDKQSSEHDVIDEACHDQAVGYTVFSIPVGVLFRPPETKLQNLETRDYLGRAKVIAATNASDLFVGFSGMKKLAATAGVKPPDGFVPVKTSPERHPKRSNTGDGRLERTSSTSKSGSKSPASPAAAAKAVLSGLRRSQTSRASPTSRRSPSTQDGATLVRSATRIGLARAQVVPLPTPPSSVDGMPEQDSAQQIFPPRGLLHARSTSSSVSGAKLPCRQRRDSPTPQDAFYRPVRPLPPTESLFALVPSKSLPHRKLSPAVLTTARVGIDRLSPAPPVAPVARSPSGQPAERVASWAQEQVERTSSLTPRTLRAKAIQATPDESGDDSAAPSAQLSRADSAPRSEGEEPFALSAAYAALTDELDDAEAQLDGTTSRAAQQAHDVVARAKDKVVKLQPAPPGRAVHAPMQRDLSGAKKGGAIDLMTRELEQSHFSRATSGEKVANAGAVESSFQNRGGQIAERSKIRLKLRFAGETRAMNISPQVSLGEFVERVRRKFGSEQNLPIK